MNKDTNICISLASSPGNFGANFHNSAYKELGLNWTYLPRSLTQESDLKTVIKSLIILNIKGCSVSMPFKELVIPFLDELDNSAAETGAVNTIVHRDGKLIGYNTDLFGAKNALSCLNLIDKKVLIAGSGGVAKAISKAVLELGGKLSIINRTNSAAAKLSSKINADKVLWKDLDAFKGYLFINATSVGMNTDKSIISLDTIDNYECIMDVVISPRTTEIARLASIKNKKFISGIEMCVHQASKQFEIYTGKKAPLKVIESSLKG